MQQTIIETRAVSKEYKNGEIIVNALKDVSVVANKNSLTILKGRSGAGKTTLMNIMATMDQPTAGEVIFNELNVSSLSQSKRDDIRRQHMGIVFQSGALISTLTARENVELGYKIAGKKIGNIDKRIDHILDLLGMRKRAQHFPYEMSGGENQRIAIARGIIHQPEVLFVDEPTSALDSNNSLRIVGVFKRLIEEEGVTVVMTTHDTELIQIADRVYTLNDGEIIDE